MVQDIFDKISPDAVMYLINAISFDAVWAKIYEETQVQDAVFTTENGEKQDMIWMRSGEHLYLEDENATGFMKYYAGSKYAFVALLPKEGIRVREYIERLTGEHLSSLLAEPQSKTVYAALPKFENEYNTEMSEILTDMGMQNAFDMDKADFSGLGTSTVGNIFISRVLHKTFIAVDEKGTKAGASTAVVAVAEGALPEEPKQVLLDRPFVYMIIDCEANLPLFFGTLMEMD